MTQPPIGDESKHQNDHANVFFNGVVILTLYKCNECSYRLCIYPLSGDPPPLQIQS